MRRFFYINALLLITISITAQELTDVVMLNNGSIIKGKIIENSENELKIETCCGNLLVYKKEEIKNITQEKNKTSNLKSTGYMNFSSTGVLIGSKHNESHAPFSAIMDHNYRISRYLATGITIGYETLNESVAPIGANLKGILPLNKESLLFIGTTGGYSFSIEEVPDSDIQFEDTQGGYFFNCELGIVFTTYKNTSFFAALGYRYNELNYSYNDWWSEEVDRTIYFNRLSIRMGLFIH